MFSRSVAPDLAGRLVVIALIGALCAPAAGVVLKMDVSPSTPTSGTWSTGDLIELILRIEIVDGNADQGFSGADFSGSARGLTVDPNDLKIHNVLVDNTAQVHDEGDANMFDGFKGYVKADDTWVYEEFDHFESGPDFDADGGRMQAIIDIPTGTEDLGVGAPAEFLHLILKVQSGLAGGTSSAVSFDGQLVHYNYPPGGVTTDVFGTGGDDTVSASFDVTNIPEPCTMLGLLAAAVVLGPCRRRKKTR
jgi:hypothetical protein